MAGKINSKVKIDDIFCPDENFECLKKLEELLKREESQTKVGDDYKFIFGDLIIHYSNVVSGDQLQLTLIEFLPGRSFLKIGDSDSGFKISSSGTLAKQLSNSNWHLLQLDEAAR